MISYGMASVSEFLEDNIVYRNIVPVDGRLPAFMDICKHLGLSFDTVPRKTTKEYAQVLASLLKEARMLTVPKGTIERVILIGDTRMNDGTAFLNICRSGNWKGMAFIGSEKSEPEKWEVEDEGDALIFSANRWRALSRFIEETEKRQFPIDERTALLIDLDKTALGARGRNDRVIDRARVKAAQCVAEDVLGTDFNLEKFQVIYDCLNQPEFHVFTADNQDYLVYICLIVSTGFYHFKELVQNLRNGENNSFSAFIEDVEEKSGQLSTALREVHKDFYQNWKKGDPTPFKAFRYSEFQNTAELMGIAKSDADIDELLKTEIVITQEVRQLALNWRKEGAVLFGLSDKPDEASIPTEKLVAQGYQPIHRIQTHIVGE